MADRPKLDWVRRLDGYALVRVDDPSQTPIAVLARDGNRWVLASKAGEVVMPKRPTFDHAEAELIKAGVLPLREPAPKRAPAPERRAEPPKEPKRAPAPKPTAPRAPEGRSAPHRAADLKRVVRLPNQRSFVGDPATTLRQSREEAVRLSTERGVRELRAQLGRAQEQLAKRLEQTISTGAGDGSFTAAQQRATLEQIRAVLRDLEPGMQRAIVGTGDLAATAAADDAITYLRESEQRFRGIARPLQFQQARVLDRAIAGAESSLLNRLQGDEKAGPGILARYGDNVIQQFEEVLRQRFVQGAPWAEVRDQLVEQSPFLQGAPASWAERILRTEVMGAHGRSSLEVVRNVDAETGGGMLKILCATFDGRTGADSYAVHGQIRRTNEPFEDWTHQYQTPPNRPNDREIVVAHFIEWPIPESLRWKSDAEVAARWAELGNKRALPRRPRMTTVPLEMIGRPRATAV